MYDCTYACMYVYMYDIVLVGQTNVQIPTGPQYNRLSDYSHDACKIHVQRSVM